MGERRRVHSQRLSSCIAALAAAVSLGGCDAGKTKVIGADFPAPSCNVAVPPPAGIDPFYTRYRDANGIPVLASATVDDTAVASACVMVVRMLSARPDVRQAMVARQMRVAVIARNQVTTDLPEYRDLYAIFPTENDWDALRGVGGTTLIPVSSAGEENLLCLDGDRNAGEHVLVHTFATAVVVGLEDIDSTFRSRLEAAQDRAEAAGLWQGTMAMKDRLQYFAAGVEDWFDATPDVSPPNGVHNEINTRAELRAYDPDLASLVEEAMPDDGWRPRCP